MSDDLGFQPTPEQHDDDATALGFQPEVKPPPDTSVMQAHVKGNLDAFAQSQLEEPKTETAEGEEKKAKPYKPREAVDLMDAIAAGWGMGSTSLLFGGGLPDVSVPEHANRMMRIASMVSTLAGDLPAMAVGMAGGATLGAPVGGAAGSVVGPIGTLGGIAIGSTVGAYAGASALPAAIRKLAIDHYQKGDITTAQEFSDRLSAATWEGIKQGAVGALTAGAGIVAKPIAGTLGAATAEISTMATASAALEKRLPNADDFINTAAVMAGVHMIPLAAKGLANAPETIKPISNKLMNIFKATGERPEDIAAAATTDPVLKQQLLSSNPELPKIEIPSVDEQEKLGLKPFTAEDLGIKEKAPKEAEPNVEGLSPEEQKMLSYVGEQKPQEKAPLISRMKDELTDAWIKTFDYTKAFGRMVDRAMADPELEDNPEAAAQIHGAVNDKTATFLGYTRGRDSEVQGGTVDFKTGNFNGEPFTKIIKDYKKVFPTDEELNKLRTYGMAQRVLEKNEQGIPIKVNGETIDPAVAQKIVDQNKTKLEPFMRRIVDFNNRTLKYAHDSGFWSPAQFKAMIEKNKNHFPFQRIQEVDELLGRQTGGGRGVKVLEGEGGLIRDPLVNSVRNMRMLIEMAEENKVKNKLVDQVATGENPQLREVTPDKVTPEKAFKDQLEKEGFDTSNFSEDGSDAFTQPAEGRRGERMEVWTDGQKRVFEGPKEYIDVVNRLKGDPTNMSIFGGVMRMFAAGVRFGTVTLPGFVFRHAERQELTAGVYSKTGFIPGATFAQYAPSYFDKSGLYSQALFDGAFTNSLTAGDDLYIRSQILKIDKEAKTGMFQKVVNGVETAAQLSHLALLTHDNIVRFAEYSKTLEQGGSRFEAAYNARNVLPDVQKAGLMRSFLFTQTAFINVHAQGQARMVEAGGEQAELWKQAYQTGQIPDALKGPFAKAVASITIPSILLAAYNYNNKKIDNLEPWQKYGYWNFEIGNHVWHMQMPFTLGIFFGGGVNASLEAWKKDNPERFWDWVKNVGESTVAIPIPNFASPVIKQYTNYDAFSGRPVIPNDKLQLVPEMQYEPYTHETAKALGKLIGATPGLNMLNLVAPKDRQFSSPMIVENYVRDWSGGLGKYAMDLSDMALRKAGLAPKATPPDWDISDVPFVKEFVWRNDTYKTQEIDDFENSYRKADSIQKSILAARKQQNPQLAMGLRSEYQDEMQKLQGPYQAIQNMKHVLQGIDRNPEMTGTDKRQMIDKLYFMMNQVAEKANEQMKQWKDLRTRAKSMNQFMDQSPVATGNGFAPQGAAQ